MRAFAFDTDAAAAAAMMMMMMMIYVDDHEDDIDSGSLTWTCPKAAGGCTSQNQVQSNRFKNFLLSVNKQMITLNKEILPQTLKSICDILTQEAI